MTLTRRVAPVGWLEAAGIETPDLRPQSLVDEIAFQQYCETPRLISNWADALALGVVCVRLTRSRQRRGTA